MLHCHMNASALMLGVPAHDEWRSSKKWLSSAALIMLNGDK
jgi:hypothetical protein